MIPEEITANKRTQTIPYYIENHSKADYERWFATRVQGGYPKLYFADARSSEGALWRDVTIDFSGVLITCIHAIRSDMPHWLTPDAPYYAMLGRFMALERFSLGWDQVTAVSEPSVNIFWAKRE